MKLTGTTTSNPEKKWARTWTACFAVAAIVGAGCSQAPAGPTPVEADKLSQQQFDKQIQNIQNDPTKSPQDKERAIAIINSQKAASSKTTP